MASTRAYIDQKKLAASTAGSRSGAIAPAARTAAIDPGKKRNGNWQLEQLLRQFGPQQKTTMPASMKPMLAKLTDAPFNDADWQFEIKWDGYRTLAHCNAGGVTLSSRNNHSFNQKFAPVAQALEAWPYRAVLDGEVVVLAETGKADFGALQKWHQQPTGMLVYYVFDLLWIEGYDISAAPLTVRRSVLKTILPDSSTIRYSDCIEECGIDFFETAKANGLEGIIAKQKTSAYNPGQRSAAWLKIKAEQRHEAVICGYTKKQDSSRVFSSLLLGVPAGDGYRFMGQVGTGFGQVEQLQLLQQMRPLKTTHGPFKKLPRIGAAVEWLKPELVCEVKYTELTKDGLMRHPSFQGLRDDKDAGEVNLEPITQKSKKKHPASTEEKVFQNPTPAAITNTGKIFWPAERITKGELANYYSAVAPFILPYLVGRPQSLNRFPNGIDGKHFYQKNFTGKQAQGKHIFTDKAGEAQTAYLVCDDAATLLYMVNLGCIEMNPWHARIQTPDCPDWCVIDLDPAAIGFEKIIETAQVVHHILDSLEVPSYPKTSGASGLHIYIPLGAGYSYAQSKNLAELVANLAHAELPRSTSVERSTRKRTDKIYIDFLQNRKGQTICAPYAVRPLPGATASAPLHWHEVKKGLRPAQFTLRNLPQRLAAEGDLFSGVLGPGINLQTVLEKLDGLAKTG